MTLIDFRVPQGAVSDVSELGKHIVCWGSSGSGKSSIATNLAFELALSGKRIFLVDADSYHPSIAALLGLVDSGAGIAACLRLCRKGRMTEDDLSRLSQQIEFDDRLQLKPSRRLAVAAFLIRVFGGNTSSVKEITW